MEYEFSRLEMLIGKDGIDKLKNSSVMIFGIGGVGSYAVEALARSAVGKITMVDFDSISVSNINRQIHSLKNNIGENKVEVMAERIKLINPDCNVRALKNFFTDETENEIFYDENPDYVIDAIDTLRAKIFLIEYCYKNNIKIISSMGFGNKLAPEMIKISDIYATNTCPIARSVRKVLKKKGIKRLPVIFSNEKPMTVCKNTDVKHDKKEPGFFEEIELPNKITPGSSSFVPATAGMIMASYVVRQILGEI